MLRMMVETCKHAPSPCPCLEEDEKRKSQPQTLACKNGQGLDAGCVQSSSGTPLNYVWNTLQAWNPPSDPHYLPSAGSWSPYQGQPWTFNFGLFKVFVSFSTMWFITIKPPFRDLLIIFVQPSFSANLSRGGIFWVHEVSTGRQASDFIIFSVPFCCSCGWPPATLGWLFCIGSLFYLTNFFHEIRSTMR